MQDIIFIDLVKLIGIEISDMGDACFSPGYTEKTVRPGGDNTSSEETGKVGEGTDRFGTTLATIFGGGTTGADCNEIFWLTF